MTKSKDCEEKTIDLYLKFRKVSQQREEIWKELSQSIHHLYDCHAPNENMSSNNWRQHFVDLGLDPLTIRLAIAHASGPDWWDIK